MSNIMIGFFRDVLCVIGGRKLKFGSEMDGFLEVCNVELD